MVKTKTQKINVYGQQTYYMRNESNYNKKLISQLTNTLKENQWIKVSSQKYKQIKPHKITNPNSDFKPQGTYYSKGGWLFHDMCCNLDDEIIMIEVDYSNIYRITGKTPYTQTNSNSVYKKNMNDFINKYGENVKYWCSNKKYLSFNSKTNNKNSKNSKNTTKKNMLWDMSCHSYRDKNKCISNKKCKWDKAFRTFKYPYKTHSGLAIYPLPSYKWLQDNFDDKLIFNSYDVETLVLWNHEPVIKYYNLGTIREIVGNLDKNNLENDFTKYLVPKLLDKIKEINKTETL
jgi:hypothetical protein